MRPKQQKWNFKMYPFFSDNVEIFLMQLFSKEPCFTLTQQKNRISEREWRNLRVPRVHKVSSFYTIYLHSVSKIHSNLDIVNKSVRSFLFTILNNSLYLMWYALVNPQNGSWGLFTILRNSLFRGLLYQDLSVHSKHQIGENCRNAFRF